MDSWGCVGCRRGVGDVSVEDLDGVLEKKNWPLDKKVPFLAIFLDVNSRGSTWLLDGGNSVATFHFFVATKFTASRFFKKIASTKKDASRQNLRRRPFFGTYMHFSPQPPHFGPSPALLGVGLGTPPSVPSMPGGCINNTYVNVHTISSLEGREGPYIPSVCNWCGVGETYPRNGKL